MEFTATSNTNTPTPAPRKPKQAPPPPRQTQAFCLFMYKTPVTSPSNWTRFTSKQPVKDWRVSLEGGSAFELLNVDKNTFDAVESLVQSTWEAKRVGHGRDAKGLDNIQFSNLKVTKVQRIENLTLFEHYGNKRQELFHVAGKGRSLLIVYI